MLTLSLTPKVKIELSFKENNNISIMNEINIGNQRKVFDFEFWV